MDGRPLVRAVPVLNGEQEPREEAGPIKVVLEELRAKIATLVPPLGPETKSIFEYWARRRNAQTPEQGFDVHDHVGLWIVIFDNLADQVHFAKWEDCVLLPSGVMGDPSTRNILENFSALWTAGSSGFALQLEHVLCLSDVMLDPRGAVAVEDFLLGNLSYAAVPVHESDEESSPIVCYVGTFFPAPHAWTGKDFINCENTEGCFVAQFEQLVRDYASPIRLSVAWEKEKAVLKAFSDATRALRTATMVDPWQMLVNSFLFSGIRPSPLGVRQAIVIPIREHSNNSPVSVAIDKTSLEQHLATLLSAHEIQLNRDETSPTAKSMSALLEDSEWPVLLGLTGTWTSMQSSQERATETLEAIAPDISLWFLWHTSQREREPFPTNVLEALRAALYEVSQVTASEDTSQIVLIANTPIGKRRLCRGIKAACCAAVCDWFVGKQVDDKHPFSAISRSFVEMPQLTMLLNELRKDLNTLNLPLMAVTQLKDSHPDWHFTQCEKSPHGDFQFEKALLTDVASYKVQQFIAGLDLAYFDNHWKGQEGDAWFVQRETGELTVRLCGGHKTLCSHYRKGRFFETPLSSAFLQNEYWSKEHSLACLTIQNEGDESTRTLTYYWGPLESLDNELQFLSNTDGCPCVKTTWRKHAGFSFEGLSLNVECFRFNRASISNAASGLCELEQRIWRDSIVRPESRITPPKQYSIRAVPDRHLHTLAEEEQELVNSLIRVSGPHLRDFDLTMIPLTTVADGSVTHVLNLLTHVTSHPKFVNRQLSTFTPAQTALIEGLCDDFESRQRLIREMEEKEHTKQQWWAVAHLEGIEPDVRALIEDIDQIKRRATRIGRRISPAEYGTFAYDEDLNQLFKEKADLTILFTLTDSENAHIVTNDDKRITQDELRAATLLARYSVEPKDVSWKSGYMLNIRPGIHGNGWHFNTLHTPENISAEEKWLSYQNALFLFGLSRGNTFLMDIARIMTAIREDDKRRRLFNVLKLLFHRVHAPGREAGIVYTAQLLAVFGDYVTRNRVELYIDGTRIQDRSTLVNTMLSNSTSERECEKSKRWRISGRGLNFLQGLHRLVNVELAREELTGAKSGNASKELKYAVVRKVLIEQGSEALTLSIECEGTFDVSMLHLSYSSSSGETSEHSMTSTYILLQESLRSDEGINCSLEIHPKDYEKVLPPLGPTGATRRTTVRGCVFDIHIKADDTGTE